MLLPRRRRPAATPNPAPTPTPNPTPNPTPTPTPTPTPNQLNTLADEIVCLPVGWWLGEAECERVVSAVREFSASVESETVARALAVKRPKCIITGGCGFIGHRLS